MAHLYLTLKSRLALLDPSPSVHSTNAVDAPRPVLLPTFHVQVTLPFEAADLVPNPAAVDEFPEA
jgi:hypothetical protein